MTFEEFLEEKNLTPENTTGSEHALMQEAYNAGYEDGKSKLIEAYNEQVDKFNALADKYNKQGQVLKIELEENRSLVIENKQLKKKAIVWHRTNFEEPEDLPLEDMQKCLVLFRNGNIWSATFWRCDNGRCSFEGYNWKEIEAWTERPEEE